MNDSSVLSPFFSLVFLAFFSFFIFVYFEIIEHLISHVYKILNMILFIYEGFQKM